MSLRQEKFWLALWRRRLAYRRRKFRKWAHRSGANATSQSSRWRRLTEQAKREVSNRRIRVSAKTPKSSSRQEALKEARRYLGVTEKPQGSNGNPANISRWQSALGFGRVPWCGIFCGTMMRRAGVRGVTSRIASVALIEQDAKNKRAPFRGWTTSTRGVLPGDLVVIGGFGVHVEMVEKVLPGRKVQTIGGNTSSGPGGSQSNGGGCFRRVRASSEIRGFALVNYPNR